MVCAGSASSAVVGVDMNLLAYFAMRTEQKTSTPLGQGGGCFRGHERPALFDHATAGTRVQRGVAGWPTDLLVPLLLEFACCWDGNLRAALSAREAALRVCGMRAAKLAHRGQNQIDAGGDRADSTGSLDVAACKKSSAGSD